MAIKGTYVFKEQGKILSVSKNLITDDGRREILRFLAGQRGALGGTLGVGVGDRAPLPTDKDLELEFEKTRVNLSAPNFVEGKIVYKGLLSAESVGRIYEVGLWSSTNLDIPLRNLLSFDSRFENWSIGTFAPQFGRLGVETLQIDVATNTTVSTEITNFAQDLTGYSNADQFVLSFFVDDPNCDAVTIRLLGEDNINYYEYVFNTPVRGYNIVRFTKNDLVKYGTVGYNEVVRIMLIIKSNTTDYIPGVDEDPIDHTGSRVYLDKLSIRVKNLEVINNTLVSRSLLPGPVVKRAGVPMDIEYYLELTI